MKKVFALIMAMVLFAMPFGAMAEGIAGVFSVGNFVLTVGDEELGTADVTLSVAGGLDEEKGLIGSAAIAGGEDILANVTLTGGPDGLKAYLSGMSNSYGLTTEQLNMIAQTVVELITEQIAATEEGQMLMTMLGGYVEMLTFLLDSENAEEIEKLAYGIMEAIGFDLNSAVSEQVVVLEQEVTLNRYDALINLESYGKLMEAYSAIPGFNTMLSATGMSLEDILDQMLAELSAQGVNFEIPMTIWAADESPFARIEMAVNMEVEEEAFSIPYVIDAYDDGTIQELSAAIGAEELGIAGGLYLLYSPSDEGTAIVLSLMGEGAGTSANAIFSSFDEVTEDGQCLGDGQLIVLVNEEEVFSMHNTYEGAFQADENGVSEEGTVTIGLNCPFFAGSLSFDIAKAMGAISEDAFDEISSVPMVDVIQAMEDEEALAQAEAEFTQVLNQALEGIMNAPGVGDLAMNVMFMMMSMAGVETA